MSTQLSRQHVDALAPEPIALLIQTGHLYQRRTIPVDVRLPHEAGEVVDTVIDGELETDIKAYPTTHRIVTGADGEEYAVPLWRFQRQYHNEVDGHATPYPRHMFIMQNPYGSPVSIGVNWGADGSTITEYGGADCYFAYELNNEGAFDGHVHLIHDQRLVDAHYEYLEPEEN